jgi:regulator of protease activity HflC (stomatin/prohibitin superfamily)
MDGIKALIIIILVIAFFWSVWRFSLKRVIVFEYERGVVYRQGKFYKILQPGGHFLRMFLDTLRKVDIRARFITIPGQDVLSSDNISVKVSLAANFKVDDPFKALNNAFSYSESLYSILQLELRDLFGSTPIDELLVNRKQIGTTLFEKSKEKAAELGLALLSADIKDIMLPGDLKNIFAQIINARNEGLAALERARGESAALRNLANTSKLLENNPALLQLRILHALESKSGNTIILSTSPEMSSLLPHTIKK